jgi:hypothetical protein
MEIIYSNIGKPLSYDHANIFSIGIGYMWSP